MTDVPAQEGATQPDGQRPPASVAPRSDVGSVALALALATGDRAAVGRNLRDDVVVVPILDREDGTPQVQVFPTPEGSDKPYQLHLFSSTQTLSAFLQDAPDRAFSLRRRDSLAPFITRHGAALQQVVIDPAGPSAMTFEVKEVLAALDPEPPADDPTGLFDETGTGISGEALHALGTVDDPGGYRGIGIELNLPDHWAMIELDEPEQRERQIREIVKQQTVKLGDRSAPLRRDLREKMIEVADKAEAAGGKIMAYLLLPGDAATLALNLTLYWHDLGPEAGTASHLQRVQDRLNSDLGQEGVLTRTETLSGPFLRHIRQSQGAEEVGGQDLPLLLIDYWAEAPGKQSIARLAFSTPHIGIRDEILRLTDKVLFSTEWILGQPSEDAPAAVAGAPDPAGPGPEAPSPATPAPSAPSPAGV
ncbi:SseB family protein [Promicromonospora sp. NPDC057138]|uniref:SseB family protein n=1 Tax=Promicromonospora sp. NPDC057138 TaxID=3346031 RepID=UPI00364172E8